MDKQSVHLPGEIIEEILSRLPVKSLVRFRCVSKSWGCLISSKRFMKSHLQISSKNTAEVILYGWRSGVLTQCSVESLFEEIYSPQFERPMNQGKVVGSCNGLVCIYSLDDNVFILLNPSTKISKKLPKLECESRDVMFGFGWDESSDDYKVFVLWLGYSDNPNVCKVYSSKTNSWKTIEIPDFDFEFYYRYELGKFVDGKLHWYATSNEIVCFDLKSEMIGTMECPVIDDTLQPFLSTGVVAGRLSLITMEDKPNLGLITMEAKPQVWVMKEYGVKESWQKLSTLSHVRELLEPPFSAPFVVGPNSEIMLFEASTFIVYHPNDHVFCDHFNATEPYAHIFIQTLVSPSPGADIHSILLEQECAK